MQKALSMVLQITYKRTRHDIRNKEVGLLRSFQKQSSRQTIM